MGDDAQNAQESKLQYPPARSGHLYDSRGVIVKQDGPKEASADGLNEKESGLELQPSIAIDGEVGEGRKVDEDALAQGVNNDGIVQDDAAVDQDSQPDIATESGPGVNNIPLGNSTARVRRWLSIGLAACILYYSLVTGSWSASKLTLTCAVVAITVGKLVARKGRKDRNKPTIALDEALASKPRRAGQ